MVDVPLPRGQCGGGGAFAFPKEQGGSKGQIAEAGAGEEEGFAFAQGDEQQVDAARLVPEPAFAVAAGGGAPQSSSAAKAASTSVRTCREEVRPCMPNVAAWVQGNATPQAAAISGDGQGGCGPPSLSINSLARQGADGIPTVMQTTASAGSR